MKKLIFFILVLTLCSACAKKQPQAAWLKIDEWVLNKNNDALHEQGELSPDLTAVFITVDGKSIGTYSLPAVIPIIAEGIHEVIFQPGIINNGISKTKKRYPFMEDFKVNIDFKVNDTINFTPETRYFSEINFLIEDFESPSMKIEVSENSLATLERVGDPEIIQWGDRYGRVVLTETDSVLIMRTTFGEQLPKGGRPVYLEFDYYNTNSCLISTLSFGNDESYTDDYLVITPQKEEEIRWKHAYIELTENISYRFMAPYNEVQFTFMKDDGENPTYFLIDNLKIIYSN